MEKILISRWYVLCIYLLNKQLGIIKRSAENQMNIFGAENSNLWNVKFVIDIAKYDSNTQDNNFDIWLIEINQHLCDFLETPTGVNGFVDDGVYQAYYDAGYPAIDAAWDIKNTLIEAGFCY